jgi:hypothetical protein
MQLQVALAKAVAVAAVPNQPVVQEVSQMVEVPEPQDHIFKVVPVVV